MLGGPDAYSGELASVAHMVRIHSGNGPHPELDAATERCFALALDDAGIPDDARLRSTLVDWFAWSSRVVNHTYHSMAPTLPAGIVQGASNVHRVLRANAVGEAGAATPAQQVHRAPAPDHRWHLWHRSLTLPHWSWEGPVE
jgi:hypothetical protein